MKFHAKREGDMHRFEFLSQSWTTVDQLGCLPDRKLEAQTSYCGFHKVFAYGPYLLAFGCEQGDENNPPKPQNTTAAKQKQLILHAFDFCSSTWSYVPTLGSPCFTHCCALVLVGHRLIAVGHSPTANLPLPKRNTSKNTKGVPVKNEGQLLNMKVCVLDLSGHGHQIPAWSQMVTSGAAPVPSPNMSTAFEACEDFLVLFQYENGDDSQMQRDVTCVEKLEVQGERHLLVLDLNLNSWKRLKIPDPDHVIEAPVRKRSCSNTSSSQHRVDFNLCFESEAQALYLIGGSPAATEVLMLQLTPSPLKVDAPKKVPNGGTLLPIMKLCQLDLTTDLRPFCCNELMSDVIINVSGTTFYAHRVVLAAASPRFRSAFQSSIHTIDSLVKPNTPQLNVSDVQPQIMEIMLQYIYGCLEAVPQDLAMQLFSASDRYGLTQLREVCFQVLLKEMALDNVTGCVLLADRHQHEGLLKACVSFAGKSYSQMQQVLSSAGYLHLTIADPRLGQQFLQASMQQVGAAMGLGVDTHSPFTPI
ncbi:hypothetical protein CEUSTIGMA_g1652.t1 [Chlamydomonas eustigma]|uniref:BTB domain-containing protein n=1 Tax=Chlamydomonas eustigma TaxID=1157962 RepID=A0A250WTQ3_9CHLO|nr:hypothetical protein CEUSTIGMA_g1652.t1 [Chlamydomonas eustigma]|eukprot:GAX74203.1 hypothetical protein CEUSTIGMA_g1652.t1 [Chlamydomonas eustigma]